MKFILPIIILIGAVLLGKYLINTGPEAKKRPFVERLSVVEVKTLKAQDYTVKLKASGLVKAGTQTNLTSDVSGRILKISDSFNEGNYFEKGVTLISIDSSNYENALAIATSDVAGNRASLAQLVQEEKSTKRSYQLALSNLKLGKAELLWLVKLKRNKLVTRSKVDAEYQKVNQLQQRLEEAQGKLNTFNSRKLVLKAKINSSLSRQKQEHLNLSRTAIKAPYAGRVLSKSVDIGQFVGVGAKLGVVYATNYVVVELPLSLNQFELLGFDDNNHNKNNDTKTLPKVSFTSANTYRKSYWKGKVVRTSAALDAESRQIKVIARIDDPFLVIDGTRRAVKIGQYLDAKIQGRTFKKVYVLNSSGVRQNKEILLLKNNKVHIVAVEVLFNTSKETIVRVKEDIEGQLLITTSMNQAVDGMKVITLEEHRKKKKKNKNKNKNKNSEEKNKNSEKKRLLKKGSLKNNNAESAQPGSLLLVPNFQNFVS